jgi:DNA-binding protein HU-beta/integration host factor subunit alpha
VEALEKNESVEFRNFGVFEVRERKERVGRNPNQPENDVMIPARRVVKFKPGKVMKQRITGS